MNPEQIDKMISFTKRAGQALAHAEQEAAQVEAGRQKAAAIIPAAVEALMTSYVPDTPEMRAKAASMLADHSQALEILTNWARQRAQELQAGPATLGEPYRPKQASETLRPRMRYIGERTSEKTAADLAYEAALGFPNGISVGNS